MTKAIKKDYVVLVGGGIGPRWLSHDSIEDDGELSAHPPTTTDPVMAFRSTSHSDIQRALKTTVARYPNNQFRVDVLDPLEVVAQAAKPSKEDLRAFQVTAAGFDGSTDETDDLVFWVSAPTMEIAKQAAREAGGAFCAELPKGCLGDVDFELPRQATEFSATLLEKASALQKPNNTSPESRMSP